MRLRCATHTGLTSGRQRLADGEVSDHGAFVPELYEASWIIDALDLSDWPVASAFRVAEAVPSRAVRLRPVSGCHEGSNPTRLDACLGAGSYHVIVRLTVHRCSCPVIDRDTRFARCLRPRLLPAEIRTTSLPRRESDDPP